MKTDENKTKTYSVKFEKVLSDAFEEYLKNTKTTSSKALRFFAITFLIERKLLPSSFKDKMKKGGDRYNPLMNDPSVPQNVKDQRRENKIKQAAKARAVKSAKANNGGVANTGNISGMNVILGSGKVSQKNLRK